jgi:four helix bundle protein
MTDGIEMNPGSERRGHRDLKVYQLAYRLAMEVFRLSRTFPEHERYSLTSQIRRSSRSVAANIAEGYRKRQYPHMFVSKMADSDAEATETLVWLDFARDCGYLSRENHRTLAEGYEEIGRMLNGMIAKPSSFALAS